MEAEGGKRVWLKKNKMHIFYSNALFCEWDGLIQRAATIKLKIRWQIV
jgi:hypothetical protein